MNVEELKKIANEKLSTRDYYGLFEVLDGVSNEYLSIGQKDYSFCVELISQNQDLYENLGSSKQFESDYGLSNRVRQNRNKLFLSCLTDLPELKPLFKRCVGDYTTEY